MVQFSRDMRKQCNHIILSPFLDLAVLAALGKRKLKWNHSHHQAFEEIKKVLLKVTFLPYNKFNRPFEIHIDAGNRQLGVIISQDRKSLALYSRKLSRAQRNYTTTEQELISNVKTLKALRNILLEQIIKGHADHKKLVHYSKLKSSQLVLCWRLLLEEFGP